MSAEYEVDGGPSGFRPVGPGWAARHGAPSGSGDDWAPDPDAVPATVPFDENEIDSAAAGRLVALGRRLDRAAARETDPRRMLAAEELTEKIFRFQRELSGLPTIKPPLLGEMLPDCWIRLRRRNPNGEIEVVNLVGPEADAERAAEEARANAQLAGTVPGAISK